MPKLLRPDRLDVQAIYSSDIDGTLDEWEPEDRRRVHVGLFIAIGWNKDGGADDFQLEIITNDIRKQSERRKRSTIYVDEFDWPSIKDSILHVIAKCERPTWHESVAELRKRFAWECEGMPGS